MQVTACRAIRPLLAVVATAVAVLAVAAPASASYGPRKAQLLPSLVVDRGAIGGVCSDTRPLAQVSAALPLCTLDAAEKLATAGTTVFVRRGSYPGFRPDGGPGARRVGLATFRPYPGESVSIAGIKTTSTGFLRFTGFRITSLVTVYFESHDIQFVGNDFSPAGIYVRPSKNTLIEGNLFHDIAPGASPLGYGITAARGSNLPPVENLVIRNNHFVRLPNDAIQAGGFKNLLVEGNEVERVRGVDGAHADTLQMLGGDGAVIRRNFFHDNNHGIWAQRVPLLRLVIENNIFARYCGTCYATQISDTPGARIVNNTYYKAGLGVFIRRTDEADDFVGTPTRDVVVGNNIMDRFGAQDPSTSLAYEDHNIIDDGRRAGPNDIASGASFVDPEHNDFRLRRGSPGIDAGGVPGGPGLDLFGRRRFGRNDIGAVEFLTDHGFGLAVATRKVHRFAGRRGFVVTMSSPVSSKARAGVRVRIPVKAKRSKKRGRGSARKKRKRFIVVRLRSGEVQLGATPTSLRLRPTGKQAKRIKRALKKRRFLRGSVTVVGTDIAKDTQRVKRSIRVLKAKSKAKSKAKAKKKKKKKKKRRARRRRP